MQFAENVEVMGEVLPVIFKLSGLAAPADLPTEKIQPVDISLRERQEQTKSRSEQKSDP